MLVLLRKAKSHSFQSCLLLLARLLLFVLSFGCDACKVGIALSLVCLVREGRPVCWVCSLLNFSFCQLSPSPQAKDTAIKRKTPQNTWSGLANGGEEEVGC